MDNKIFKVNQSVRAVSGPYIGSIGKIQYITCDESIAIVNTKNNGNLYIKTIHLDFLDREQTIVSFLKLKTKKNKNDKAN